MTRQNYLWGIDEQRELITLDRQGTQQQRPESPMVTALAYQ